MGEFTLLDKSSLSAALSENSSASLTNLPILIV
jgi:hypothetical protein